MTTSTDMIDEDTWDLGLFVDDTHTSESISVGSVTSA